VSGLYAFGAVFVNVKGVCTNTVPVCAYRGAGRPEAAYLLERLVDAAARQLGMSPDAIRRINFVPPSAMPYTSAAKLIFDSGEFEQVMDRCMKAAQWSSFATSRSGERAGKAARHRHGDLYRALRRGFQRPLRSSSRTIGSRLVMGNQEYGTGLITSYRQLVDQLGVDADRIDVIMGDTDRTPAGLTGAPRVGRLSSASMPTASM
jgi:carbon-monoxide dehydrogenase large subunit